MEQQALAGFGGRDAARGAGEETDAETGFEGTQGVAEGRGRDAELGCGAGEAAFARHGEEGQQVG